MALPAKQGMDLAQHNLGSMYANRWGVPRDYVFALMWWNITPALGHEDAQRDREIVAKQMAPDQIAEDERLAREWMAKHQR